MRIPAIDEIINGAAGHKPQPIGDWRYYSVLLPLVEKEGGLYVLYELRSKDLEVQPGEVAFPGGAIEENERPDEAARRETAEELGVPEGAIEVFTELDYLIADNNRIVYCFLGKIDAAALENAEHNKLEVAEFFLVPLGWLLETEPEVYHNHTVIEPAADFPIEKAAPGVDYKWRRWTYPVPIYVWPDPATGGERYIWGMTARLTMAFCGLLRPYSPSPIG